MKLTAKVFIFTVMLLFSNVAKTSRCEELIEEVEIVQQSQYDILNGDKNLAELEREYDKAVSQFVVLEGLRDLRDQYFRAHFEGINSQTPSATKNILESRINSTTQLVVMEELLRDLKSKTNINLGTSSNITADLINSCKRLSSLKNLLCEQLQQASSSAAYQRTTKMVEGFYTAFQNGGTTADINQYLNELTEGLPSINSRRAEIIEAGKLVALLDQKVSLMMKCKEQGTDNCDYFDKSNTLDQNIFNQVTAHEAALTTNNRPFSPRVRAVYNIMKEKLNENFEQSVPFIDFNFRAPRSEIVLKLAAAVTEAEKKENTRSGRNGFSESDVMSDVFGSFPSCQGVSLKYDTRLTSYENNAKFVKCLQGIGEGSIKNLMEAKSARINTLKDKIQKIFDSQAYKKFDEIKNLLAVKAEVCNNGKIETCNGLGETSPLAGDVTSFFMKNAANIGEELRIAQISPNLVGHLNTNELRNKVLKSHCKSDSTIRAMLSSTCELLDPVATRIAYAEDRKLHRTNNVFRVEGRTLGITPRRSIASMFGEITSRPNYWGPLANTFVAGEYQRDLTENRLLPQGKLLKQYNHTQDFLTNKFNDDVINWATEAGVNLTDDDRERFIENPNLYYQNLVPAGGDVCNLPPIPMGYVNPNPFSSNEFQAVSYNYNQSYYFGPGQSASPCFQNLGFNFSPLTVQ